MSSVNLQNGASINSLDFAKRKRDGKKFSVITCYDSAFAKHIEKSNIEMVLVGDSLGNVVMGFPDTIKVTIDHMIHHSASVARVLRRPFLCVDMPFFSYQVSKQQALENAGRLVQEGGAQAVKLEGGEEICDAVAAIVKAGIPVVGHIGLTPQSVHALGGFKVQGRGREARDKLISSAMALQEAGAMAVVLELVPAALALEVTSALRIPTIGIGAGPDCDGQVLVLHDMLGFDSTFKPKFLKKYADLETIISTALSAYDNDVKEGSFPTNDHSFSE